LTFFFSPIVSCYRYYANQSYYPLFLILSYSLTKFPKDFLRVTLSKEIGILILLATTFTILNLVLRKSCYFNPYLHTLSFVVLG